MDDVSAELSTPLPGADVQSQPLLVKNKQLNITITTLQLQPFHALLNFVRDYPGEPVPKKVKRGR